jgi:hypothetical protein
VSHPCIGLVSPWRGSVVLKESAPDIEGKVFGSHNSGDRIGISLASLSDGSLTRVALRHLLRLQALGEDLMEGNQRRSEGREVIRVAMANVSLEANVPREYEEREGGGRGG